MSYLNAKSTQLLASHCFVCGRALCDAKSVELGIGPVCRKKYTGGDISEEARTEANQLIYTASALYGEGATADDIEDVFKIADRLVFLGLPMLAERMAFRFVGIRLEVEEDVAEYRWNRNTRSEELTGREGVVVNVFTPFDRDFSNDLKRTMNYKRPIRDKARGFHWQVRRSDSRVLLGVLARHFAGRWAYGDKGVFQVPTEAVYTSDFATARPVQVRHGDTAPGHKVDDNQVRGSSPLDTSDFRAFRARRVAAQGAA